MSNIPYLAAHLEKRSGKEESFNTIKRHINGENLTDHDWAIVYSYFLPPKPKKITSPFEWVSIPCDQKEQYAFCKYILVEHNRTISANTKVAHVIFDNLGLSQNWYDTKKGSVGDDVAIMPNIDDAMKLSEGIDFDVNFNMMDCRFDIIDTPSGLSYVLPWNNKGVNKKYFDITIKSLDSVTIQYSIDGPFRINGSIKGMQCCAVIMPFNLNGIVKANEIEKMVESGDLEYVQYDGAKQLSF